MVGGARRDRTDDLLLAKQALSQLSYGPFTMTPGQQHAGGLRVYGRKAEQGQDPFQPFCIFFINFCLYV